jgi:hypothetical protein
MQVPQIPKLNQDPISQPQNLYDFPDEGANKKKLFLMIGGVILLVIILAAVLFSGGGVTGQVEMKNSLQATSDALGIIDEYSDDLKYAPTKNDVALTQILIRNNHQELNTKYNKLYKPKKRFNSSPKPDAKSKETLDEARRNNKLDTEIIEVLRPKITEAGVAMNAAKKVVTDKELSSKLAAAEKDMQAILEMLEKTNTL